MLSRDTWNYCGRRRWVTSWTLSLHKPFLLLVHARYDLTFAVCYVMIAIGAATPGEAACVLTMPWHTLLVARLYGAAMFRRLVL